MKYAANSLDYQWMPFTANRSFKADPRLLVKGEGQQAHRDLLTGGSNLIELAGIGSVCDRLGKAQKPVCLTSHGRGHDHHLMTSAVPLRNALGNIQDALCRSHRGATIFVND